jgi:UDP-2-acetamido-2-deoxy-ribo-hexuluronate aminotransferase
MNFIDLKLQNLKIRKNINKSINKLMDNSNFIMGKPILDLEKKLSDFINSKNCITVSSGTDALLISLMSLNIGRGDEVITTPLTWISTVEVIKLLNAKPVFADIDEKTCNIDPELVEKKITKKTKAIIPVSLYGQIYDVNKIKKISLKYKIPVIEDGAQSFGAKHNKIYSCNSSLVGCTSFFPTKPLGGYGDGGAIFTNDEKIANICRQIRLHGQINKNQFIRLGINGRMDTIQSVIINEKLKLFKQELVLRNQKANFYNKSLKIIDSKKLEILSTLNGNFNAWAQYTIRVKNNKRTKLINYLKKFNIPTAIYYPIPLNKLKIFNSKYKTPISDKISKEVLSLPMSPYLKSSDQKKIVKKILNFFS